GHPGPHGPQLPADGAAGRHVDDAEVLFPSQGHHQLPAREGAALAALQRRTRAPPLPQWRRAVHRLQAVRSGVPRPVHHHRGGTARRRQPTHHSLRHRHDEVHLLRVVRGVLPGGRHRRGAEFRVLGRDAGGAALRQGQAARQRRPLGARTREAPGARRSLSL
ncbi:MAG: NADH-ubiquinone oxidoreductase chain I, partial [uncultured Acetobacteraceae bacterium]